MKNIECFTGWNWDDFALWPSCHIFTARCEDESCRTVHGFAVHFDFFGFYFAVQVHLNEPA
jgi:hypothetical protein